MNMEDNQTIILDVTVEEYQRDLASGLREDELLQPGRHTFKRGGFFARHGLDQPPAATAPGKVRILIDLDHDILDYFKQRASNGAPYQTQINKALRQLIEKEKIPQQIAA